METVMRWRLASALHEKEMPFKGICRLAMQLMLPPESLMRAIQIERPCESRQPFGLSKAEAAVAQAMLAGSNPDECAADLGVSIATVRTQLRAIYEKTQTRSHSEAVAALMSMLPRQRP